MILLKASSRLRMASMVSEVPFIQMSVSASVEDLIEAVGRAFLTGLRTEGARLVVLRSSRRKECGWVKRTGSRGTGAEWL